MTKKLSTYLGLMIGALFLFVAGIAPALAVNAPAASPLHLTAKEKAWLAEHKTVRVAFDGHFPPYSFLNDDSKIEGLAVDILNVLADRVGITLEISPKTVWKELYAAAQNAKWTWSPPWGINRSGRSGLTLPSPTFLNRWLS